MVLSSLYYARALLCTMYHYLLVRCIHVLYPRHTRDPRPTHVDLLTTRTHCGGSLLLPGEGVGLPRGTPGIPVLCPKGT